MALTTPYYAPYRGGGGDLPGGTVGGFLAPGQAIGRGIESAGESIGEGIRQYFKNKAETQMAQGEYEGLLHLAATGPGGPENVQGLFEEKTWKKLLDWLHGLRR